MAERDAAMMRLPVRVESLSPAAIATLLGAALGLAAFGAGITVVALLVVADVAAVMPVLIGVAVLLAVAGAIGGRAVWRTAVDRIDWRRLEAEQLGGRMGGIGRARARTPQEPDHQDG